MKFIGAHVSTDGGVENAPLNAAKIGATAFALFLKNQRQWVCPDYKESNINMFKKNLDEVKIESKYVLPHASYLINLGNSTENRIKSITALLDDVKRAEMLGLLTVNFHPGSTIGLISVSECLTLIAKGINEILSNSSSVKLVLELTAGQGNSVGHKFSHIADIINQVEDKNRIGVCIDTMHIYGAGYDITNYESYNRVMDEFDKTIGFNYLSGVHINDSKSKLGSNVDRHENLGNGLMGLETFKFIMNDSRFDNIPMILETIDDTKWADEIKMLSNLIDFY